MRSRHLIVAFVALTALTGCGDDTDRLEPSPRVTPTPLPTPTPVPTPKPAALSIATPGVAGGTVTSSTDPATGGIFRVTVSDPDVPTAAGYEDFNFDGDETISVQHDGLTEPFEERFEAGNLTASTSRSFSVGGTQTRIVPAALYEVRRGVFSASYLSLPRLEKSRKTAASPPNEIVPEHVRLIDVAPVSGRAFQLLGTRTQTSDLPASGTRTMVGEVYGSRYRTDDNGRDFVGDASLMIDFAARTLRGTILVTQYAGSSPASAALTIEMEGAISGDGAISGRVTARSEAILETGYVTGALFGPQADEIGLALKAANGAHAILAGLVAGLE